MRCIIASAVVTWAASNEAASMLQRSRKEHHAEQNHKNGDLPSKGSRIAIIGAGPSGIHMASFLGRLGYNKTTVLEKTDRVGGKSFTLYRDAGGQPCQQGAGDALDTVNCIAQDMG